jgi:hypothetical protein
MKIVFDSRLNRYRAEASIIEDIDKSKIHMKSTGKNKKAGYSEHLAVHVCNESNG